MLVQAPGIRSCVSSILVTWMHRLRPMPRDCVNASNRFHRRYDNCRFRKTTSYATSSLFFSYFSYGEARVRPCARASAYSSLESRGLAAYYLATYVEKRPYRSSPTRRFVTIRAPSARVVSRKLSRSRNSPFTFESH